MTKGPDRVSPFTVPKMMLNAAGSMLSIQFGMRGPNYAVATACASATNAMADALKSIQDGLADVMLTGGTEAAMTRMGMAAFQNIKALSTRNDDPAQASRPSTPTAMDLCSAKGPACWCSKSSSTHERRRQNLL